MLVLSRKVSQRIIIGGDIVVTIVKMAGQIVRVGVDAPLHLSIKREELVVGVGVVAPVKGASAV